MGKPELSLEYRRSAWSGYVEKLSETVRKNYSCDNVAELPPQVQIQLAWVEWMRQEGYQQDSQTVRAKTREPYQKHQVVFEAD